MNTEEMQKEALESDKTDILRKVRDRSQTAKIASGVAAAVVSFVPAAAKALEELGIEAGDDVKELTQYVGTESQLNEKIPGSRFSLTFRGYDSKANKDHMYEKEFRVEDGDNGHVIIKALTGASIVEGLDFKVSYFKLINKDGTVKHKIDSPGANIYVDDELKWDWTSNSCDFNSAGNSTETIHPAHDGSLKVVTNLVLNTPNSIVRVSDLEAPDYCAVAVPDPKENGPFEELYAPECKLPSGHVILGHQIYKEKYDKSHAQIFVYDLNGELVPYQRNADGSWVPEPTPKGNADFVETQRAAAFLFRTTKSGRQLIIGVIDSGEYSNAVPKYWVLEVTGYTPNGMPILSEVPFEVVANDPNAPPPDADGDGISDADEEASGGCVGYTDAGENFVDTNGNGESDPCESKCETYANEVTLTPSDSLPCTGEFGYEAAKQLKDGSFIHYSGTEPILADDGTIFAQSSSKLRYIHATLVGAVPEPEPARDVSLPDGYETEIQVNSGTAHVTGFDFLGQSVEVTITLESGLVDLGFVYGAEVGVEGSDIELTVGSEYQPCGVAVCGNQNPEPPAAEPAQTVEEPVSQADEGQAQSEAPSQQADETAAEPPPAQAELPSQAEPPMPQPEPQAEPAVVELVPDAYSAPDAVSAAPDIDTNTAEETGGIVIPPVEQAAEPAPDAVSSVPDADAAVYVDAPPVDATVTSPEADVAVYVDAPLVGTDVPPDIPQSPDTQSESQPTETQSSPDFASDTDKPNPDTPPANVDQATGTDTPVQGQDSQKDTPQQGKLDTNQPDASQPDANQAGQDTENPQPKPEDKKEGGGGGCAIKNPNDPSTLNALMALGAGIAAWVLKRRQRAREILTD